MNSRQRERAFVRWAYPAMFYLSLLHLLLIAAVLVLWIDVPLVGESIQEAWAQRAAAKQLAGDLADLQSHEVAFEHNAAVAGAVCLGLLLAIWPLFWLEQWTYFRQLSPGEGMSDRHQGWWLKCLMPPLRMCSRLRRSADYIWFPRAGWRRVDRRLRRDLECRFSLPMIWIALLILPVLGLHAAFNTRLGEFELLRICLHVGTGLIWFAFAAEFIVMVSVAEKKLVYCRQHWLDLAIILLPLISFLRSLRLLRASRLANVGRLQQVSKLIRAYRLRGVAMRALRALLLLEVVNRLLRVKPETRLRKMEELYEEKQHELKELGESIAVLQAEIARREAAVSSHGQEQGGAGASLGHQEFDVDAA